MRRWCRSLWLGVGLLAGCVSCLNPHRVRMADTDPNGWTPTQQTTVSYQNEDTLSQRDLCAVVRFCHDFDYDKLGLSITTVTPDGYRWCDTVYMDVYGRLPQVGMYGELEQPYRQGVVLKQTGRYLFVLAPVMPDTVTRGVAAVGIRLDDKPTVSSAGGDHPSTPSDNRSNQSENDAADAS